MTSPDPSPLTTEPVTAEERALAERLARLGPHAEPAPALDARVLAAAHAAARAPAARRVSMRRRWPAVLGLAASLVLAVGLAWRLRPQEVSTSPPQRETVAGSPAAAGAATPANAAAPAKPAPPNEPAIGDGDLVAHASPEEAKPPAAAKASTRTAPAVEAAPDTPVVDSPALMTSPPPPAPPPPPQVERDAQASHAAAPAFPTPPAASAAQDSGLDSSANEASEANASSGLREGDEPSDEVPPATAESPAVRDAWLQRIHDLIDTGDIAGARASLREFERRYPDYPLPEDLRALGR